MHSKITLTLFSIFFLIFSSCGTGRITSLDTKENEAIVFGKISIKDANQYFSNSNITLHFYNEELKKKGKVDVEGNGFYYIKLPLGHNSIVSVEYHKNGHYIKNLPNNYLSFYTNDNLKIYYLGDLNIKWNLSEYEKKTRNHVVMYGIIGGAIGGVIAAAASNYNNHNVTSSFANLSVEKTDTSKKYFNRAFPENQKEIVTELINIKYGY